MFAGFEKRERNGIIMNHVLRKMTAFASALVMLGGSIVYGQFGGVFCTVRISAEEAESEYSVDLERSYNMIALDGKYYAFNIARSISKKDFSVNDDDIFIVPAKCKPDQDYYGYYEEDEETRSRIFVLGEKSVDLYRSRNVIVPEGIMEIRQSAFSGDVGSITIADSVISLGEQNFGKNTVMRGHIWDP